MARDEEFFEDDEEEEYEDEPAEEDFAPAAPKKRRAGMEVALLGVALALTLTSGFSVAYRNWQVYGYNMFGLFPEKTAAETASRDAHIEMVREETVEPEDGVAYQEIGVAIDQGTNNGVRAGEVWKTTSGANIVIRETYAKFSFGILLRDGAGDMPVLKVGQELTKLADDKQFLLSYLDMLDSE